MVGLKGKPKGNQPCVSAIFGLLELAEEIRRPPNRFDVPKTEAHRGWDGVGVAEVSSMFKRPSDFSRKEPDR